MMEICLLLKDAGFSDKKGGKDFSEMLRLVKNIIPFFDELEIYLHEEKILHLKFYLIKKPKNMNIESVIASIRNVPDFPQKGIMFKDITTAFKQADVLHFVADQLYEYYKDKGITKVVGIESRGFVLGSILAYKLNAGFVLLRKPGKLPADTYKAFYSLEYGSDSLEIHKDALEQDDVVLLHDDLLATGGSANAALDLIEKFDVTDVYTSFMIELSFLNGKQHLKKTKDVYALIEF